PRARRPRRRRRHPGDTARPLRAAGPAGRCRAAALPGDRRGRPRRRLQPARPAPAPRRPGDGRRRRRRGRRPGRRRGQPGPRRGSGRGRRELVGARRRALQGVGDGGRGGRHPRPDDGGV
ncbi:MAG: hypothetical protein AVDCRST_MAG59-1921, partial [uncultured Thermomicrobiales bacterium]